MVMAANLKAPTRLPPVAASMQKQRRPRRVMTQTNPLPLTRNGGCYSPPTRAQSARQPIPHALHSLSSSSSLPPRPVSFSISVPPPLLISRRRPHRGGLTQRSEPEGWGARVRTGERAHTDGGIIAGERRRLAGGQERIKRDEPHGGKGMKKRRRRN